MISAHESPLAAIAFDMSGTKLATASNKVFDIIKKNIYFINFLSRVRLFVFIVLLMVQDFLNFVEEFDGMRIFNSNKNQIFIYLELLQYIH
jgi:hypothetical protein